MKRIILIVCGFAALLTLGAAPADAGRHRTTLRVRDMHVLGFHVRVVSFMPGDHYRIVVRYSRHPHTVPTWAGAQHRHTATVAAINGNTWVWRTMRPIGTIRTSGRWRSRVSNVPAVGFRRNGRMVFGARSARRAGALNILSGKGYLLRGGKIQRHFPWAASAQIHCNTPNTDGGYGCWRPVEARWKSGRVGFVMIAYANMAQAARVLKRMGVWDALTGDSGGSTNLWTRQGWGGCSSYSNGRTWGHCFGALHHAGYKWERAVPDVAMIVKTN